MIVRVETWLRVLLVAFSKCSANYLLSMANMEAGRTPTGSRTFHEAAILKFSFSIASSWIASRHLLSENRPCPLRSSPCPLASREPRRYLQELSLVWLVCSTAEASSFLLGFEFSNSCILALFFYKLWSIDRLVDRLRMRGDARGEIRSRSRAPRWVFFWRCRFSFERRRPLRAS